MIASLQLRNTYHKQSVQSALAHLHGCQHDNSKEQVDAVAPHVPGSQHAIKRPACLP